MRRRGEDAYRTLIHTTEQDVLLVAINGYPLYGISELMGAANAVNPEQIDISPTVSRTISLRDPRIPDADMSWQDILAALNAVREDPGAAHAAAASREGGEHRLPELRPDKPWDDPTAHPALLAAAAAVIPELDRLTHDATYFRGSPAPSYPPASSTACAATTACRRTVAAIGARSAPWPAGVSGT